MKYVIIFILIIASSGCQMIKKNQNRGIEEKEIVLMLNPGPKNPRNSEGDFITLKNGRILFIYSHFTGESGSDFGNAILAGRFSDDNGKTWSQEDEIIIGNEGDMNVMSVSLLRLQNGEIALFYLRKNSLTDCMPFMRKSVDEALTWSEPVSCIPDKTEYFVLNNSRVIQLKSGRLLMPVSLHKSKDGQWDKVHSEKGTIFCYYSDDNGNTWKSGPEVENPDPQNITMQEPGVIELKDGSIMMFIRTNAGVQYFSYSHDQGENWSIAKPGNLKSPLSPASLKRIPSTGDLLAVWNNNETDNRRSPLTVAVSRDEGKSWTHIKNMEDDPEGWYCYIAIHFVDKNVLLGYCAGNRPGGAGLATTRLSRLSLKWIYQ